MNKTFKKALLISLSFLTIESSCLAVDVTVLHKGQPAPYEGLLFTKDKAQIIQKEMADADKMIASLNTSINTYKINEGLYEQEIKILKDDNQDLETAVQNSQNSSFWYKAMWFGIGALVTGATAYAFTRK